MRKSKLLKRKSQLQSITLAKAKEVTDARDDGQGDVNWYDLSYWYDSQYDNQYDDMIKLGWYHEPVGCGHEGCCPQHQNNSQHGWNNGS